MYIYIDANPRTSGKNTHFMDGPTTVAMWRDCYTSSFARRRKALGVGREARGCLVYDGFLGNQTVSKGVHLDLVYIYTLMQTCMAAVTLSKWPHR